MSKKFSADEIFEMAEEIERNGAAFYRKAADNFSKAEQKEMLEELSVWEKNHERDFHSMRQEILGDKAKTYDPDEFAAAYLHSIADGYVFDLKQDPKEIITKDSRLDDILSKAIELEKNSIIFYLGMKDMMTGRGDRQKIQSIIHEEMKHITILSDKLVELNA